MGTQTEHIARTMASSLAVDWCTTAPFQIGDVQVERVGFGDVPLVFVMVYCHRENIRDLVPIARQIVYRELESSGLENTVVEFTPTVQHQCRRKYVDCNERSPSKGKFKIGELYRFAFEIGKEHVKRFRWDGFCGRVGHLPEASHA